MYHKEQQIIYTFMRENWEKNNQQKTTTMDSVAAFITLLIDKTHTRKLTYRLKTLTLVVQHKAFQIDHTDP